MNVVLGVFGSECMTIDIDKLRKETFEYLDSISDEELLNDLIECGLELEDVDKQ